MSTENTSLKNTTPAGDSTTPDAMVIEKNTYQRTFLIVAGFLLALLVLIAVVVFFTGAMIDWFID